MQVYNLFKNNGDSETAKIFNEYYMGPTEAVQKRYRESILTNFLSQMIETLVQKGYPVLFPDKNPNTIAIEQQIDFLNKHRVKEISTMS
jgi:hypothetical protein